MKGAFRPNGLKDSLRVLQTVSPHLEPSGHACELKQRNAVTDQWSAQLYAHGIHHQLPRRTRSLGNLEVQSKKVPSQKEL